MLDRMTTTTTPFQQWLIEPGLTILAIIGFAWLGRHFGGVVITQMVNRLVRSTAFNPLSPEDVTKRRDTLSSLFTVIWKVVLVVVASALIFEQLFPSVDLAPFFASAGLIGVAIGFGAQSLIKDFLSGIFIIVENQYRVGDIVDIEGAAGTVERVTIRSTVIRDVNGNVHFLPNGQVMHVINKTMGFSKVHFTLVVDPDTDIDKLAKLIDEVGTDLAEDDKWKDKILEAPHFLNIGSFSDVALEATITGKTHPSQQWSVTGEMRRRLLKAFIKHKIELAHVPGLTIPEKK
jgi:small-conductance mechanosensitive channel